MGIIAWRHAGNATDDHNPGYYMWDGAFMFWRSDGHKVWVASKMIKTPQAADLAGVMRCSQERAENLGKEYVDWNVKLAAEHVDPSIRESYLIAAAGFLARTKGTFARNFARRSGLRKRKE